MELLVGTSDATSEPARALRVLAARPDSDPGFDEALADYQRVFGCRALEAEVAEPTLAESPELLSAMLDRLRDGRYDPDAEAADLGARRQRAATDARRSLRARDRERFDLLLARAAQAYPLRDENVFLTIDAPIALVRYAAQEAGRRLTAAGVLDSVDQAFFCTAEELADAVADLGETSRGADPTDTLVERVRRRRGEHRWALEHPGPPSYGERPPGTPSFRFLPRSVRLPTEAMMWIGEAIVASDASLRPERPARRRAAHRHPGLGRPVHRARPTRALRGRSRPDPHRRCPGLPVHAAVVVGDLPGPRRDRDRHRRGAVAPGDHRPRAPATRRRRHRACHRPDQGRPTGHRRRPRRHGHGASRSACRSSGQDQELDRCVRPFAVTGSVGRSRRRGAFGRYAVVTRRVGRRRAAGDRRGRVLKRNDVRQVAACLDGHDLGFVGQACGKLPGPMRP